MSVYSSPYGQDSNPEGRSHRHGGCGFGWKPIEIVAMVLGFIVFWPIGLAILVAKIWQKKSAYAGDLPSFIEAKVREKWKEKWQGNWEAKMGRHWASRSNCDFGGRHWDFRPGWRSSGNAAFDDWRQAELARLEEERQKLLAAEREFADYMENLRRAKDREEFDRFMNARRNGRPEGGEAHPSA
jgi:hypothetical protein